MKLTDFVIPLMVSALTLVGAMLPCQAQEPEQIYELKSRCISELDKRTAAFVAQDWEALEKRAKLYVSICKGAFNDSDLSAAHEQIAYAVIELGRPAEGLRAAASCIEAYYGNSGCHIRKAVALQKLDRLDQARRSMTIALRLIAHNIDVTKLDLARPQEALDRELLEAELEMFTAQLDEALALQKHMSND